MIKIIKCQPKLRKRRYDEVIVGIITITDRLLEPNSKYEITIKKL